MPIAPHKPMCKPNPEHVFASSFYLSLMWEEKKKRTSDQLQFHVFVTTFNAVLPLIDVRSIQSTLAKRQACVRSAQSTNEESVRRHTVFQSAMLVR